MSIQYMSPSDKIGYRKFFAKAVEALLSDASGWDFHSGNVRELSQRHLSLMALEFDFRVTYVHESGLVMSARGTIFTAPDGTKPEVDITANHHGLNSSQLEFKNCVGVKLNPGDTVYLKNGSEYERCEVVKPETSSTRFGAWVFVPSRGFASDYALSNIFKPDVVKAGPNVAAAVDITEIYFMSYDAGTSNCPAPVVILNDNLHRLPQIANVDAWAMNIHQRGGISAELFGAETILANLKEEGFFDE